MAQFKLADFSTCDAPCPGRSKTVTTLEIIDPIHELILEDRCISFKSIAEKLDISREWIGYIIHEDLDIRIFSVKLGSKSLNINGASCLSNFWNFFRLGAIQMISCRDWWPWKKPGYISMSWRPINNQWSGVIAAHPALSPQNSECKNLMENFSPRSFGFKTTSFSLITFQRTELSIWSITHFCWYNWTPAAGRSPKGSCKNNDIAPSHKALATHKKLVYLGFHLNLFEWLATARATG